MQKFEKLTSTQFEKIAAAYGTDKSITGGMCVNNLALGKLSQYQQHSSWKILVAGEQQLGGQTPLSDLPSVISGSSMAIEMARFSQMALARVGVDLPQDFYLTHTVALNCIYLLEGSVCFYQTDKKDEIKSSQCTRSVRILQTVPGVTHHELESLYAYIGKDMDKQLESGSLHAVTVNRDSKGLFVLKKAKVSTKHILSPLALVFIYMNRFVVFLQKNLVHIRCQEKDKGLNDFSCTLNRDILLKYGDSEMVEKILQTCLGRVIPGSFIVPVIGNNCIKELRTINIFKICQVSVV